MRCVGKPDLNLPLIAFHEGHDSHVVVANESHTLVSIAFQQFLNASFSRIRSLTPMQVQAINPDVTALIVGAVHASRTTQFQLVGEPCCLRFDVPRSPKAAPKAEHHYAHALHGFYDSNFPSAVVLVADQSVSIWSASKAGVKLLNSKLPYIGLAWNRMANMFPADEEQACGVGCAVPCGHNGTIPTGSRRGRGPQWTPKRGSKSNDTALVPARLMSLAANGAASKEYFDMAHQVRRPLPVPTHATRVGGCKPGHQGSSSGPRPGLPPQGETPP